MGGGGPERGAPAHPPHTHNHDRVADLFRLRPQLPEHGRRDRQRMCDVLSPTPRSTQRRGALARATCRCTWPTIAERHTRGATGARIRTYALIRTMSSRRSARITDRQEETACFIPGRMAYRGGGPTIPNDIGAATGLAVRWPVPCQCRLRRMERLGAVSRHEGATRSLPSRRPRRTHGCGFPAGRRMIPGTCLIPGL